MFGIPTETLYVCDGKRECGKPSCLDSSADACHHTSDPSHALYGGHDIDSFSHYSAIREGQAAIILVEPIRG